MIPYDPNRFPVSGSKKWSFEVSSHSSTSSPRLTLLSGVSRATIWSAPEPGTSAAPESAASSSSSFELMPLGLDREVGVELGAHRLDQVDRHLEHVAAVAGVADQGGVLERLGPHAGDHVACRAASPSAERSSSGRRTSPNGSFTVSPSSVAGMKFIAGEPMNPATNRFVGRS